jgi:hypothetical protein
MITRSSPDPAEQAGGNRYGIDYQRLHAAVDTHYEYGEIWRNQAIAAFHLTAGAIGGPLVERWPALHKLTRTESRHQISRWSWVRRKHRVFGKRLFPVYLDVAGAG